MIYIIHHHYLFIYLCVCIYVCMPHCVEVRGQQVGLVLAFCCLSSGD